MHPRMLSVGRYTLHGEIASGGMATVHFGQLIGDDGVCRAVAIKCLRKDLARDPDFVTMFMDEARLASRIRHRNVVSTIDVAPDGSFLVMECIAGESLASLMTAAARKGETVPLEVALRIMVDVLHGLMAAHTAVDPGGKPLAIVHRDVSPQNIIVGVDGLARVLDFGIAKAAIRDHTTKDGRLKGKLRYMAPEQVQDATVTARTDIYSASVVLWELLTGEKLFQASNDAAILAQVLEGTVVPPSRVVSTVPKELDAITLRGLERDAAARYDSAYEMAAELEATVKPASARNVAQWVERVASDTLRKRAEQVARIEQRLLAPPAEEPADATPAPAAGTRTMERRDVAVSVPAPVRTPTPMATTPRPASKPPTIVRTGVLLFLGTSLVVFAASVAIHRRSAARIAPEELALPPAAPAESSARTVSSVTEQEPVVPPPSSDEPPEQSAQSAQSESKSQTSRSSSKSSGRPRPKPATTQTAAAPSKPDCSQHYYYDPSGIRRVKPECL